jgi:tRNA (cytidine/uridine-2'-O-)-methyltransferase
VFGKESVGLSAEVLAQFEQHLKIPISPLVRSFNLANACAFVIGEAKRQLQIK